MQINGINSTANINTEKSPDIPAKNIDVSFQKPNSFAADIPSSVYRANYAPNLSFTGNAPKIKQAFIITGDEEDVPLRVTEKNRSFIIDFDSQSEIIYGTAAIDFLDGNNEFEYDTQIIFPKNCEGSLYLENGKKVPLSENSGVLINKKTKAKVKIEKGYPFIIMSKLTSLALCF